MMIVVRGDVEERWGEAKSERELYMRRWYLIGSFSLGVRTSHSVRWRDISAVASAAKDRY